MLDTRILYIALEACSRYCQDAAADDDVTGAIDYADAVKVIGEELRSRERSYQWTIESVRDVA